MGTTTNHNLHYPEPGAHPNVVADVQALAEATDTELTDVDNIAVALAGAVTTNTDAIAARAADGVWQDWIPGHPNLSVGNAIEVARYTQIGDTVHFTWHFKFGTTSIMYGGPSFTLPIAPRAGSYHHFPVQYDDYGTGLYIGEASVIDNNVKMDAIYTAGSYGVGHQLSTAVPFTWTTNDQLTCRGTYEV